MTYDSRIQTKTGIRLKFTTLVKYILVKTSLADRIGNVYQRNDNGNWSQRDGNQWNKHSSQRKWIVIIRSGNAVHNKIQTFSK